ncbi:MAG: secretin N-terminal domain-containing protein, partial [Bacteroidales bacterium]
MKLDVNIITAENVAGQITLKLKDVPFYEAFEMIMERAGLAAIQTRPNIIKIMREGELPTERKTVYLKNRSADELKTSIEGLLSADEAANTTIGTDSTSNSFIITAPPSIQNKIKVLINKLDIKSPQIKIKARLVEVTAGKDITAGMSWAATLSMDNNDVERVRAVKDMGNYGIDSNDQSIDYSNTLD